jgi:hypothetical protein
MVVLFTSNHLQALILPGPRQRSPCPTLFPPSSDLDSRGFVICPRCHTEVHCGPVGIANWSKRHWALKKCDSNLTLRKADQAAKKQKGAMSGWLAKGAEQRERRVPAMVKAPDRIHGQIEASGSTSSTLTPLKSGTSKPLCPLASRFITDLHQKTRQMPSWIPYGIESDGMAVFAVNPESIECEEGEEWRTLDMMLNRFCGYGTSAEDVSNRIRKGSRGMDGLVNSAYPRS